jgi:hypothetical protein
MRWVLQAVWAAMLLASAALIVGGDVAVASILSSMSASTLSQGIPRAIPGERSSRLLMHRSQ